MYERGRNMKNFLKKSLLLVMLIFAAISLAACSPKEAEKAEKPTVVCSGFAQYDWVCNLIGGEADRWNIVRINESGADMHSYQPTAEDAVTITGCDLIVYTGGISEEWIEDMINQSGDFAGREYALLSCGDVKFVDEEGHQGHSHEEADEHIWLSPAEAVLFCSDITELLSEIDPENSQIYEENCKKYTEELENIDSQYKKAVEEASKKTVIVADRFPFRYLFEDCGLTYFAAFSGCSAETEASFERVAFLAGKLDEENLKALIVTEDGNYSIAQTVIENSKSKNAEILTMDSMQSVDSGDKEKSYIKVMEANLKTLKKALS